MSDTQKRITAASLKLLSQECTIRLQYSDSLAMIIDSDLLRVMIQCVTIAEIKEPSVDNIISALNYMEK